MIKNESFEDKILHFSLSIIKWYYNKRNYQFLTKTTYRPYLKEKEEEELSYKEKYMNTKEWKDEFRKNAKEFMKKH